MTLVKRGYFNDSDLLPNALDSFFSDFFPTLNRREIRSGQEASTWSPRTDIEGTNDHYVVRMDIPGVDKENLNVSLENNVLTIKGERKYETKEDSKNHYLLERAYGQFERSFRLTEKVDQEKISADYKNGVLTVKIPKAEEAKPRSIEIR
jgi:HSP20 family protein